MKVIPVMMVWRADEGCMVPEPRFAKLCARQYVDGESYPLAPVENRSMKSHNAYFASLHDAWMNIPESEQDVHDVESGEVRKRWPTEEHLRKWALVEAGYASERTFVFDTPRKAREFAIFYREDDEFAVIKVSGSVVKIFKAESQDMASMKKDRFEDSKRKVLDIVWALSGMTRSEAGKHAGRSA